MSGGKRSEDAEIIIKANFEAVDEEGVFLDNDVLFEYSFSIFSIIMSLDCILAPNFCMLIIS